jgi:hypothetical protein
LAAPLIYLFGLSMTGLEPLDTTWNPAPDPVSFEMPADYRIKLELSK